jgi:DNA-directed RNA polymerase subunit M/transcription elongation factor TFIIS
LPEYVKRSEFSRRPKLKKKPKKPKFASPVYADTSLDELWEQTAGTPYCPKCDSVSVHGHIREIREDIADVEWFCEDCGHKWSSRCPFEDGTLILDDE